jgi:hypothetical protein
MELQTKKCHKCIYVDFLEKIGNKYHQIWKTVDGEKRDTKFDCGLKGEKQYVLHSNRPGPAPSLAMMVSLSGSPLSIGHVMIIFIIYRLLTVTREPENIFSELKLASLKYYTP